MWCNQDTRAQVEQDYGRISNWNTSQVTSMKELFKEKKDFDDDIGTWNVGNVTTMYGMFSGAEDFNQPIGSWDVSKVTNMNGMF
ncbi:BspA family leucine-rich repeat surface protein [archaeon]|nr:MAG: BspA family leucine-rich repeat surface protein [archaeon]